MSSISTNDTITRILLRMGVAVPFLYFGLQLIAAPFYPGYSFVHNVASELGSDLARYPTPFNLGIILMGVVAITSSLGFWRALRLSHTNLPLACLTSAAVAVIGVQSLWAGIFPMPDPRHGGHPLFIVAMIALPFLLTLVLWNRGGGVRLLRVYLLATLLLMLCMIPLMSGMAGIDNQTYRGLLQRLLTLAVFPPLGVAAFLLLQQEKEDL